MNASLPTTLGAWLSYIESLHHRPIDMGLDRVRAVAGRIGLRLEAASIVVAGTNGKGSTCAMLDAILRAAGYKVGRYGSPHLLAFNERAQLDGRSARDEALVEQFHAVEHARGDTTLTYFEFTTLAILRLFAQERVDVAVLEVGLGGRLDAVNLVDADCAMVTTVDLDHTELLGPTRERIGWEKAHVFRAGRPAICVDPAPPASLLEHAAAIGARLWCLDRDFRFSGPEGADAGARQWNYRGVGVQRLALPWPALRGEHQLRNAAGVLAALDALRERLPVDQRAVREGLGAVRLKGRFQVVPRRPVLVLDVAHNAHAARALAAALESHREKGHFRRTHAVFGMLADKDAAAVVQALRGSIDSWHLVPTAGERGQSAEQLARSAFHDEGGTVRARHDSVAQALHAAQAAADPDDRIVVLGSFVIVADALRWLEHEVQ